MESEKIEIPLSLYRKIEGKIKGTEFDSVSAYVSFIVSEVLREEEGEEGKPPPEDEEKVKARLKALGYLE
jgi:Arc/MetJ-type ribon-helix-helix transcriptional regulator